MVRNCIYIGDTPKYFGPNDELLDEPYVSRSRRCWNYFLAFLWWFVKSNVIKYIVSPLIVYIWYLFINDYVSSYLPSWMKM